MLLARQLHFFTCDGVFFVCSLGGRREIVSSLGGRREMSIYPLARSFVRLEFVSSLGGRREMSISLSAPAPCAPCSGSRGSSFSPNDVEFPTVSTGGVKSTPIFFRGVVHSCRGMVV